MKIHYTKKDPRKAKFVVSDIDFTTANAIRRAIMTYVPSMAMEKITLYDNTSPLYEEMIAQRIGLIPLTTDLETYSLREECKCGGKGCARCQVSMILEKVGPGTVYSGDIKSRDPKVKPVYDKILITKMREGQSIKMEMVASLGFMTQHAKYQSALASYKQINDKDFEFFVESYNNIPAQEMVEIAMGGFEKKLAELEDAFLNPGRKKLEKKKKEEKKEEKVEKKEEAREEKPKKAAKKK